MHFDAFPAARESSLLRYSLSANFIATVDFANDNYIFTNIDWFIDWLWNYFVIKNNFYFYFKLSTRVEMNLVDLILNLVARLLVLTSSIFLARRWLFTGYIFINSFYDTTIV